MNKCVVVTGGAGYIGSHTCLKLAQKGYFPVVIDNLVNGHEEFVQWGPLEKIDIRDRAGVEAVLSKYKPAAILHFAALTEISESLKNPLDFYENNVIGSLNLLSAAIKTGIKKIVFSSTCATYGLPLTNPIDEKHPQKPTNPYGQTKLIVEQAIKDFSQYKGLRSVILRYFNAGGADFSGRIGERHSPETHVIPLAIQTALGKKEIFKVFGSDYNTSDGTTIRDYIHVLDLANAHIRALEYLLADGKTVALNLGTGTGTSVLELLKSISKTSKNTFPIEISDHREGDLPALVADSQKAKSILGWQPCYTIDDITRSAWTWHSSDINI